MVILHTIVQAYYLRLKHTKINIFAICNAELMVKFRLIHFIDFISNRGFILFVTDCTKNLCNYSKYLEMVERRTLQKSSELTGMHEKSCNSGKSER